MYKSYRSTVEPQILSTLKNVLKDGAKQILDSAKLQTPVDDGELIGSATIDIEESYRSLDIAVHYGSDNVSREYAVLQHENPFFRHPIGNYKFLENPFNQIAPTIMRELRSKV